jgi:glycosyltransferase 2 family protein
MNAFATYPNQLALPAPRDLPRELSRRTVRTRVLFVLGLIVAVAAIVTLLPGLASVRDRLAEARPAWLALGAGLKVLSGVGFVAIFRVVFARELPWRRSFQIGFGELGANALLPTGGAGGLALGAWALRREGMPAADVARRTVAFFLLTSVANVLALALIGIGLAARVLPGETSPALTIVPAAMAILAVIGVLGAGRVAARLHGHLEDPARQSSRGAAPAKLAAAVADGVGDAVALLRERNALLIAGMAAYLFFDLLLLQASFAAFGAAPPLATVWIAYLIGELGGLIPVPGGIGGVDAGLVGTLALYNVPLAHAASAVLAYRAIALWVPALLAAPAFLTLRRALARNARAELAASG